MNNGNFAIYKGIEYKASGRGNKLALYSNADDVKNGFTKCLLGDNYELVLDREEVDSYFSRNYVCNYKNDEFLIISENEKQYLLLSGPRSYLLKDLGFEEVSRGEYRKWVNKIDVIDVHDKIVNI